MVLPLVEDVLRSLVLREAAVFARGSLQRAAHGGSWAWELRADTDSR